MGIRVMQKTIIGSSEKLRNMLARVSSLAQINRPLLIMGERGSGKESVAERLHYLSQRWEGPLIKVNCAAISEDLIDSELFGHEAGAFTGAKRQRKGRFELAHEGTLFLDEIGTLPVRLQEKLLRTIEYGEIQRVGSEKTIKVSVRIIAATNADLEAMALSGTFRADLLDRLAFAVLTVPPLRERKEDILELSQHFGVQISQELGLAQFPNLSNTVKQELLTHNWPGNIRELKNVIERAVLHYQSEYPTQGSAIELQTLITKNSDTNRPNKTSLDKNMQLDDVDLLSQDLMIELDHIELDPFREARSLNLLGSQTHLPNKTSEDNLGLLSPERNLLPALSKQEPICRVNDGVNQSASNSLTNSQSSENKGANDKRSRDFDETVSNLERALIKEALAKSFQKQTAAAKYLGMSYDRFRALYKKYRSTLEKSHENL